MSQRISSKVTESAKAALPWRKGVAWWLVLIEGLVIVALGLYMLLAPVKTRVLLGQVVALVLVVAGAVQLIAALRAEEKGPESPWVTIRGAVGLGVGLLIFILLLLGALNIDSGRVLLGIGSLAYGGIGLYVLYLMRASGIRPAGVVNSAFFVLIGVLLIAAALGGRLLGTITTLINILLLLAGAFLILWALALRNGKQKAPVA